MRRNFREVIFQIIHLPRNEILGRYRAREPKVSTGI